MEIGLPSARKSGSPCDFPVISSKKSLNNTWDLSEGKALMVGNQWDHMNTMKPIPLSFR